MDIKFEAKQSWGVLPIDVPVFDKKANNKNVTKKNDAPVEDYSYSEDTGDKEIYIPLSLNEPYSFTAEEVLKTVAKLKTAAPEQSGDNDTAQKSSGVENKQSFGSYNNFSVNEMVMILLYLIQKILPKEIEATDKLQENVIKFLANLNKANQAMALMSAELAKNEREQAYQGAYEQFAGAIANVSMAFLGAMAELQGHFASNAKSQLAMENFNTKWSAAKDKVEQVQGLLKDFKADNNIDAFNQSIITNANKISQQQVIEETRNTLANKQTELATTEINPGGLLYKDSSDKITMDALEEIEGKQTNVINQVTGNNSNIQKLIDAEKAINDSKNSVDWNLIDFDTTANVQAGSNEAKALAQLKQNKSIYNVTEDATGNITEVAYIQKSPSIMNGQDKYDLIIIKYDTTTRNPKDYQSYLLNVSNNSKFDTYYNVTMDFTQHPSSSSIYAYQNSKAVAKIEEFYQLDNGDLMGVSGINQINELDAFNLFKEKQTNYKAAWDYTDSSGNQVQGDNSLSITSGAARAENGYQLSRLAHQDMEYAQEYDQLLYGQKLGNEGMLQPFMNRIESNKLRYDSAIKFRQALNNALIAAGRSLEGICNSISQKDGAEAKFQGEMLNLEQTLNNSNLQQMQQLVNDLSGKITQIISDVSQNLSQTYQTMVQAANLRNG